MISTILRGRHWPAVLATLLVASCASQTPLPKTYPISYQQKMQAAHHWDVLAQDVAQRITARLEGAGSRVHVVAPEARYTFSEAFHSLLLTHLVDQGFQVTKHYSGSGLSVEYEVQLVTHADRGFITHRPGQLTALTAGLWVLAEVADKSPGLAATGAVAAYDAGAGHLTGPVPDNEVIVTTSVLRDEQYVMRTRDIYYVSDNNRDQYHHRPKRDVTTRSVSLTAE